MATLTRPSTYRAVWRVRLIDGGVLEEEVAYLAKRLYRSDQAVANSDEMTMETVSVMTTDLFMHKTSWRGILYVSISSGIVMARRVN